MVRILSFDAVDAEVAAAPQPQAINNPNLQHGMSRALSCYPIVVQLARSLDLNSLDDLSRSCRQFRANLLQYRANLIAASLRCYNETTSKATRLGDALALSFSEWGTFGTVEKAKIMNGNIAKCARDLVSECRHCRKAVCRNCITKQSISHALRGRHRRLCKTCSKVSIFDIDPIKSAKQRNGSSQIAAQPATCVCADDQWLCSNCAVTMRSADTTYLRGWSWRSRYSTCGGFGAGLGEGNEGVECGRGEHCLASNSVEKEIECDASDIAYVDSFDGRQLNGHGWHGSSYNTQEIVGIGGQVKVKYKKMIVVGAIVQEHEDERMHGNYLHYERAQEVRSWCSWCHSVIPSTHDQLRLSNDIDEEQGLQN